MILSADINKFRFNGLALMLVICLAGISSACADGAAVGNATAGEQKSRPCHACHGSDGISINELFANLAAQKQAYLRKQITAFRDGTRVEPTMAPFVMNLTEQDIADIAAYFSGLPCIPAERAKLH